MIRYQMLTSDGPEQVKTSGRFQHPPELRQTLVQPLQVIIVALPLVIPALGLHLKYGGSVTIRSTEFSGNDRINSRQSALTNSQLDIFTVLSMDH